MQTLTQFGLRDERRHVCGVNSTTRRFRQLCSKGIDCYYCILWFMQISSKSLNVEINVNGFRTAVWILPTGIWGQTDWGALSRGWGGRQSAGTGVWCLTELTSTDPPSTWGKRVGLRNDARGRLRELLGRSLFVQLNGFTNCTQTFTDVYTENGNLQCFILHLFL